jgi:hypothetical protein
MREPGAYFASHSSTALVPHNTPATPHPVSSDNTRAPPQLAASELSELYDQPVKQLNDGDWIKQEISAWVEGSAPGSMPVKQMGDGDWIKEGISVWTEGGTLGSTSSEVPLNTPATGVAKKPSKSGDDLNGKGTRHRKPPRKDRGRFDESMRRETSNTRSIGACLRCHNQRVRVSDALVDL